MYTTGDNIHTACAIARQCGILTPGGLALEGPEFRKMTPKQLDEVTMLSITHPKLIYSTFPIYNWMRNMRNCDGLSKLIILYMLSIACATRLQHVDLLFSFIPSIGSTVTPSAGSIIAS